MAVINIFNDRVQINRHVERLAHTHVQEGVHIQIDSRVLLRLNHLYRNAFHAAGSLNANAVCVVDTVHVLHCKHSGDIQLSAEQSSRTGGHIGDGTETNVLHLRLLTPVVFVYSKVDVILGNPFHKFIAPGAVDISCDFLGRLSLNVFLVGDNHEHQIVQKKGIRHLRLYNKRVIVDSLVGINVSELFHKQALTCDAGLIIRRNNVLGGEIAAIVEFHALAEMECPGQIVVCHFPALGQEGNKFHFGIFADQSLIGVPQNLVVRIRAFFIGIKAGYVLCHGHHYITAALLSGSGFAVCFGSAA